MLLIILKNYIKKLIYTIKKKLQLIFKQFSYEIFNLFYGKIEGIETTQTNKNIQIQNSTINQNFIYKVYIVKDARIYTDTINDTAVIIGKKIVKGPSFQIRNTKFESIEKNIVFSKGTPRVKKKVKGTVLSLLTGGAGNNNYWHWIFDVLPRFKIINNLISLEDLDFFLLPNINKKFQKETLDLLDIPVEKRLSSLKNRHIESPKIIVVDHPYVIKNDPSNEIQNIPEWIINWLKNSFETKVSLKDSAFPQKIYIDISDSTSNLSETRKVVNEEEVKNKLKGKNYKIIRLGDYSFSNQIKFFYNAQRVVGLHGAGFANTIFCQPDTNILELQPSGSGKVIKNLAIKNKLNYNCISVAPEKHNVKNQFGHIRINLEELEKKI